MAWYRIAQSSEYSEQIEIWEEADTDPGLDYSLYLKDVIEKHGTTNPELFSTHLPFELQVPIIDVNNKISSRIRGTSNTKHKILKKDPSSGDTLYEGYINKGFKPDQYTNSSNIITLSGYDGITTLKGKALDFDIDSYMQWGLIFENLLHGTGIQLDVIVSTSLQHQYATGQNGIYPNQHRSRPQSFLAANDDMTYHNLLMAMLNFFKMQVFQSAGQWFVMERYHRQDSTVNHFNITQDSVATPDPSITLIDSDLRREPNRDDMREISTFERTLLFRTDQYEFNDPAFQNWTEDAQGNAIDLIDWDVENSFNVDRNNVTDGGIKCLAANYTVEQSPDYPLSGDGFAEDVILHFNLDVEFTWDDPGSGYPIEVDYAEIYAINRSGGKQGVNEDGSWGGNGIFTATLNSGGSTSFTKTIDIDMDPLPNSTYAIVVKLYLTGDTSDVIFPVIYHNAGLTAKDRGPDIKDQQLFTYSNSDEGLIIEEEHYLSDSSVIRPLSLIQYYDGSQWIDTGVDWPDYLNRMLSSRIISQAVTPNKILDEPCAITFDVSMQDTVDYTFDGELSSYLPIFIQRNSKGKQQRVKLLEIKDESHSNIPTTFE